MLTFDCWLFKSYCNFFSFALWPQPFHFFWTLWCNVLPFFFFKYSISLSLFRDLVNFQCKFTAFHINFCPWISICCNILVSNWNLWKNLLKSKHFEHRLRERGMSATEMVVNSIPAAIVDNSKETSSRFCDLFTIIATASCPVWDNKPDLATLFTLTFVGFWMVRLSTSRRIKDILMSFDFRAVVKVQCQCGGGEAG